jgi:hypothetical protein
VALVRRRRRVLFENKFLGKIPQKIRDTKIQLNLSDSHVFTKSGGGGGGGVCNVCDIFGSDVCIVFDSWCRCGGMPWTANSEGFFSFGSTFA